MTQGQISERPHVFDSSLQLVTPGERVSFCEVVVAYVDLASPGNGDLQLSDMRETTCERAVRLFSTETGN